MLTVYSLAPGGAQQSTIIMFFFLNKRCNHVKYLARNKKEHL